MPAASSFVRFSVGRAALQLSSSHQMHSFERVSFLRPPGPSVSMWSERQPIYCHFPLNYSVSWSGSWLLGRGAAGSLFGFWGFLCPEQLDSWHLPAGGALGLGRGSCPILSRPVPSGPVPAALLYKATAELFGTRWDVGPKGRLSSALFFRD